MMCSLDCSAFDQKTNVVKMCDAPPWGSSALADTPTGQRHQGGYHENREADHFFFGIVRDFCVGGR
jgi:hypothetical protein